MKRFLGSSACVAIGLAVACGSSDDVDMSSPGLSFEEVSARYPAAFCDAYRSCWGDALELLLGGRSCLDLIEPGAPDEFDRFERLIAEGKIKYDGTRAEACLKAIAERGCSNAGDPAACVEMLDGTVATGGDCSSNVECKGGDTYCRSAGACPGRCALREGADGPCSTDEDCQSGLECDRAAGHCFRPAGAGDRCDLGGAPPCSEAGLICLGKDDQQDQPGNCRSADEAFSRSSGETCAVDAPLCQTGLRCVIEVNTTTGSFSGSCRAPVGSGAACKSAFPDSCPFDEYCAVPPQMLDGRCTRKPGAGAACIMTGDDPICAPGLRCDGGQCRQPQKLGGSCQDHAVCYSDMCLSGRCVAKGACE